MQRVGKKNRRRKKKTDDSTPPPGPLLPPRVQLGPLPRRRHGARLVLPPLAGDGLVQGVVRVGRGEEGLNREQDGADLEGGRPLVFQDVQADAAQAVDVGVVDTGEEADLKTKGGWGLALM